MEGSSQHCTGGSDQIPPKEMEIEEGKVVVLQIAEERRETRNGKIYPTECKVPENSEER